MPRPSLRSVVQPSPVASQPSDAAGDGVIPGAGRPPYLLRPAEPGDELVLSELVVELALHAYGGAGTPEAINEWALAAYSPAMIRSRIMSPDCLIMVCVDADGVVHGTSYAKMVEGPHETDCYLGGTYLTRAARGNGMMADVYSRVVSWLCDRGARRMLADVHAGNRRARDLLVLVGFSHQDDHPDLLVRGMVWSHMTAEVPDTHAAAATTAPAEGAPGS